MEGEEFHQAAVATGMPVAGRVPHKSRHARQGTWLLSRIARNRGAWVLIIRADDDNVPATALLSKPGIREDVLHFGTSVD